MAAGGFKEFVAGEVLDQDEINDFLMQGMLVFAGTAARGSAIPSPVEGQFSFRTDDDVTEFYDGTDWVSLDTGDPIFQYLVIAGGGSGGAEAGGGGGAGGYRSAVPGENSGGTASSEPRIVFSSGTTFTVTVGAGGAARSLNNSPGFPGSNSVLDIITCIGGGAGNGESAGAVAAGGSGGGGSYNSIHGLGTTGQGFRGGDRLGFSRATGGGGAGQAGVDGTSGSGGTKGGDGVSSSINGAATYRAGGGGGANSGAGGLGGGGAAGNDVSGQRNGTAGTVNTGSGGGGAAGDITTGGVSGAGGSGVVILRYPSKVTLTVGAGLTSSTSTVGSDKVTTFTAGTDTVTVNF